MLSIIDEVVTALAIVVVAVLALIAARGSRSILDLSDAPTRVSSFREDSVLLALCVYMLAAALLAGITGLIIEGVEDVRATLIINNGAHVAALAACLLIARQRFEGGARAFCFGRSTPPPQTSALLERSSAGDTLCLRSRATSGNTLVSVCIVVLALGLCPVVLGITVKGLLFLNPEYDFAAHRTILALHDHSDSVMIVVALWIGASVVAPIAEESFFRGIVQTYLVGLLRSRWAAIALTSLAFGMIHYPQAHTMPALVLLAILIGYAYERTGSLLSPVVIHAVFNLKTLIWSTLAESPVP